MKKQYFGRLKSTQEKIYLLSPKFECGWYWSFGYLGNRNCHYHLSGYQCRPFTNEWRNKSMGDCLLTDYELNPPIEKNISKFCELAQAIYLYKEVARSLHIGGAHITKNPCKEILQNSELENKINQEILPELFKAFYEIFEGVESVV